MNAVVFDVALTAYIVAAVAALGSLVGPARGARPVRACMTGAGFICHTVAVVVRGVEPGRLPVTSLAEVVSLVIWAVVAARAPGRAPARPARPQRLRPARWSWPSASRCPPGCARSRSSRVSSGGSVVHVALVLIGLAALVLNFGGALMYLLQERQLKSRRPRQYSIALPPLETLDRLTYATLTAGFPFLTAGLFLGVLSARRGGLLIVDPLSLFSLVMWVVYAPTLVGRAMGHWRRPARRLLRHRGLLRPAAHARRGRAPPGTARAVTRRRSSSAGLNHRTAPVEVREQLALEEDKIREIAADLVGARASSPRS